MVRLTRIYTRGGDKGKTSLGDGSRVTKHELRVVAFGVVDEANACVGLARLHTAGESDAMLGRVQNDLFDLGADLCTPHVDEPKHPPLRITTTQVAYLHLARTVVRRAERSITRLAESERVNPEAIRYTNRLSDLLFVLARHLNDGGTLDVLWQPGANR
jgi:cob(I)alamin adenosyltransferase